MTAKHLRRNSLRYTGYDYSQSGAVFVTICTHHRQRLFGEVLDGKMMHSSAGHVAVARWQTISNRFPSVEIDAFVVMPDHIHGILFTGSDPNQEVKRATIGEVIRWFKSSVH